MVPFKAESVWALGANVTLTGLVIVFLALILLVLILTAFSAFFGRAARKKSEKPPESASKPAPVPPAPLQKEEDSEELVAVIAAAVETIYAGTGKSARVRRVTRSQSTGRGAWAAAGLADNTRAF